MRQAGRDAICDEIVFSENHSVLQGFHRPRAVGKRKRQRIRCRSCARAILVCPNCRCFYRAAGGRAVYLAAPGYTGPLRDDPASSDAQASFVCAYRAATTRIGERGSFHKFGRKARSRGAWVEVSERIGSAWSRCHLRVEKYSISW